MNVFEENGKSLTSNFTEIMTHNYDDIIRALLKDKQLIKKSFHLYGNELNNLRSVRMIGLQTVLEASDRFSFSLRSPDNWIIGNPIVHNHPPAPQSSEMRGSCLQRYNIMIEKKYGRAVPTSNADVTDATLESFCEEVSKYYADVKESATKKRKGCDEIISDQAGGVAYVSDRTENILEEEKEQNSAVAEEEANTTYTPPVPSRHVQLSFAGSDESSDDDEELEN